MRLGFSVAIQVDADVLLVDEVLAVGDAAFQQKCFEEFDRLKAEDRTILFVTHDMASVERFCDRGTRARSAGASSTSGPPRMVTDLQRVNFGRLEACGREPVGSDMAVQFARAWCEYATGARIVTRSRASAGAVLGGRSSREARRGPTLRRRLRNEVRHTIFVAAQRGPLGHGRFEAGEHVALSPSLRQPARLGRYDLIAAVSAPTTGRRRRCRRGPVALIVAGPFGPAAWSDLPSS